MGNDTPITNALKAKTLEAEVGKWSSVFGDWFVACHKLERDRARLIGLLSLADRNISACADAGCVQASQFIRDMIRDTLRELDSQ